MKNLKTYFVLLLMFSILGCSEDEPEEIQEAELLTGVFLDSEVGGLNYVTDTQEGITDEDGQFNYYEGEVITFSAGEVELGSGEAAGTMTPVSIASTPDASLESDEVKNISAFLQTLDSDGDASNGISLENEILSAIPLNNIDFTQPVINILGETAKNVFQETGIVLSVVYPEQAAQHLAASLGETYEPDNLVFESFVPAFKSWSASELEGSQLWIHETDEEGRLVKSISYEKHPFRMLSEYSYLGHNEQGLPTGYEQVGYPQFGGDPTGPNTFKVNYNESYQIESINYIYPDGEEATNRYFDEWTEEGRITRVNFLDENGAIIQTTRVVYDEEGIFRENAIYDAAGNLTSHNRFTYTEAGEIDQKITNDYTAQYSYREDLTLEKIVYTYSSNNNEGIWEYDEREKAVKFTTESGDWKSEYFFWEDRFDGNFTKILNTYYQGTLYSTQTNHKDGTSTKEFFDSEGNVYKIEHYDSSGTLVRTEEVS